MLFNSFSFLVFFPIVLLLYWQLQRAPLLYQNLLVVLVSYLFYGWWDFRFLSLLVLSSFVDYFVGYQLPRQATQSRRKMLLAVSLCFSLGLLGFFKYCDFFIHSFAALLGRLGIHADQFSLRIILPVGISFYTFQTMSYTIDVYRGKLAPTRNLFAFLAFVSFFPQLVAGPIERATNLLPQFLRRRTLDLDKARDGLRQMLWGFFKKLVVADNLAPLVKNAYEHWAQLSGLDLALGTFLFAIQIYCDFSGYSDIAIGSARLFGINLMRNFAFPYFSRDIAEFWRRWHISLSTWFRDYVYLPLGGSRASTSRRIVNVMVTFTVSGFWHGANWTFIAWGFLNGVYYIPLMLAGQERKNTDIIAVNRRLPSPIEGIQVLATFLLTLLAWVFFRSASLSDALGYISRTFTTSWLVRPSGRVIVAVGYSLVMLLAEWVQRHNHHALTVDRLPTPARWGVYAAVSIAILLLGNFGDVQFIYFQF